MVASESKEIYIVEILEYTVYVSVFLCKRITQYLTGELTLNPKKEDSMEKALLEFPTKEEIEIALYNLSGKGTFKEQEENRITSIALLILLAKAYLGKVAKPEVGNGLIKCSICGLEQPCVVDAKVCLGCLKKKQSYTTPKPTGLEEVIAQELLPYADGEWRKDFPDNWKWDADTIKRLSKPIANAISRFILDRMPPYQDKRIFEKNEDFRQGFNRCRAYFLRALGGEK